MRPSPRPTDELPDAGSERESARLAEDRLVRAASDNFQFIWRCLRRFGITPEAAVDDAVQQVFEVALRKRDRIPVGHERGFLFKSALFVAAEWRRARRRAPESLEGSEDEFHHDALDPEAQLGARRDRALLDAVLNDMPLDLRSVFVLFELEELRTSEIAELLDLPLGTVASRLRRARERFNANAARLRARMRGERGGP
jgi:RNA polymerase sigma-70 factor, ECF subfamily